MATSKLREDLKGYMKYDMCQLPFVQWDRFYADEKGATTVYGWIERTDAYKDFVFLSYEEKFGKWFMSWGTSSAEHSEKIAKALNPRDPAHSKCLRVEEHFKIKNMVRL